jgi:hypothetical protein
MLGSKLPQTSSLLLTKASAHTEFPTGQKLPVEISSRPDVWLSQADYPAGYQAGYQAVFQASFQADSGARF